MAVPGFQSFLRPMLGLALEKEVSRQEYLKEIPKLLHPTSEDREERTAVARVSVVADRASWASTYLVHAGLLRRPRRGVIIATARGRKAYRDHPDHIDEAVLQKFPEFRAFKARKKSNKSTDTSAGGEGASRTPLERIDEAREELDEALRKDLVSRIQESTPTFFEHLVIKLMLGMDYGGPGLDEHLGKTGDGGVDGVINQDKLGLDAIYLQAKKHAQNNVIGPKELQAFVGALEGKGANKGVFVTASSFSKAAKTYAATVKKNLRVIDGDELSRLLIDHDVGVRPLDTIKLKRLDEDFFSDTP